MLKTIRPNAKQVYMFVLLLSLLPFLLEGVSFPKHLFFFIVIASSTLPVIVWFVKERPFILNDVFGMLLVFRVLTDLSCVLTEIFLNNSTPTFFFSLPINGILILLLFHKHLQTPFSKKFFRMSLLFISGLFLYQLMFVSMFSIDPMMNLLTYSLIVLSGISVIYQSKDRRFLNTIVFPLCAYYAPLIFYSLFEIQIHSSRELFDQVYVWSATLTLALNLFFCRTVWLKQPLVNSEDQSK